MRINSKRTFDITLKCRPVIFSITAFGGTWHNQSFNLFPEVKKIFNLSGTN